MKILFVLIILLSPLAAADLYLNGYIIFERYEAVVTYSYSTQPPTPTDTTEVVKLWGATWTTAQKNFLTDEIISNGALCDSLQWYAWSFDIDSADECIFVNPTLTLSNASAAQRPGCEDQRGQ